MSHFLFFQEKGTFNKVTVAARKQPPTGRLLHKHLLSLAQLNFDLFLCIFSNVFFIKTLKLLVVTIMVQSQTLIYSRKQCLTVDAAYSTGSSHLHHMNVH